ncbi:MAG: NUDIX hydrolase [Phycisphaerales bacterium]|nr:NUDIX hydrolase [Phycisphaerales bacterium]
MPTAWPASPPVPQAAALCFRPVRSRRSEVLLITSRNGDWAIPKGRIDPGHSPPQAAALEALEEAGVRGQLVNEPLGSFDYTKRGGWASGRPTLCRVEVFPLLVEDLLDDWDEGKFRKRRWVPSSRAHAEVSQPGLAHVLRTFPAWLRSIRTA